MRHIKEKIVPQQQWGGKKDIEHSVTAVDENDARKIFFIGRNRLLDVNRWDEIVGALSAKFVLIDENGDEVHRTAEMNDFFKIDLPAPGPSESEGYDWVQIEAIEDHSDPDGPYESIAVRVRPSKDPKTKGENVAHFFNDEATSSFVLERQGKEVTAAVYGRNEVPNTETTNIMDKVRNALVGTTAILGFSNIQWKNLVKDLIETEEAK